MKMSKKNWISALLTVVMVISMMAIMAMPAAAEGPSEEELAAMPHASEAYKNDSVTAYKIDSVDELLAAADSTFVGTKVSVSADSLSASGATNNIHEKFYDTGFDRGDLSTYNTIYITCDLDIEAWQAANPTRNFAEEYDGFNANVNYYTTPSFILDGLGHTVKGFEDTEAFIAGNALGMIKNLMMVNCRVDAAPRTGYSPAIVCKGAEIGGVSFENVRLENCSLTSPVNGCGLFIAYPNKTQRNVSFTNCSIVNSNLECTAADAFGVGLFVGRWGGTTFTAENCVAVGNTVTVADPYATTYGNSLLFGHINSSQSPTVTINNIVAANNTFAAPVVSAAGILTTIGNAASGTVKVTNVFAANNTTRADSYGATVPMENLVVNTNNKVGTTTITSCVTDTGVTMLMSKNGASGTTIANTSGVTGYNAGAAIVAFNAESDKDYVIGVDGTPAPAADGQALPITVTFGGTPFATDVTNKLSLTNADAAYLKGINWTDTSDKVYPAGYSWETQRFAATATYTAENEAPFYITFDKAAYGPGETGTATVGLKAGANLAAVNLILSSNQDAMDLQEHTVTWVGENVMGAEARPFDNKLEIAFSENSGANITAATDIFTVDFVTRAPLTQSAGLSVTVDVKIAGTETGSGLSDIVGNYEYPAVTKYAPVNGEALYDSKKAYVDSLPSVMEAELNDGITAYKISTLEELIWAASADRYETPAWYQEITAETTAGYKTTYVNIPAVADTFQRSRYVNPAFVELDTIDRSDYSTYDTIYLAADLDIADYPGGAEAFAADYDSFYGGGRADRYATTFINFDGMGHTITGFTDDFAFINYMGGTLKNLTLVDPVVNATTGYESIVLHGVEEGGVIMENVHVVGGTFNSSAASVGGILMGMASNGNRCFKAYDCSVIDCTINATYAGSQYMGLVGGLIASPASGYPTDCVTLDNVIVQGCTINAKDLGNYNSVVLGRVDKSSGTLGLVLNNVAVFDCQVISETASDVGATFAAVANVYRINASAATDVGSIYVGNVTGKSGTAAAAPLTSVFYDQGSVFSAEATVKDGSYYTDGTITTVSNKQTIASTTVNGLTLDKAIEMMDGGWNVDGGNLAPLGHKVTFNRIDPDATTNTYAGTYEFYTDLSTGRLTYQPNGQKITAQQWSIITAGWMPAADSTELYVNGELEYMTFDQDAAVYEVPLASRATRDDNIAVYQINSVAELIKTNMQVGSRRYYESSLSGDRNYTVWNFLGSDTILITADLNMADWDYTGLATYTEGVGYTPTYLGYVGSNKDDYRSLYTSKSNDTTTYVGYKLNTDSTSFATLQELSANLYNGMAQGYRTGRNYNVLNCAIDGLNHTVRNFKDNHSFLWGTLLGKLSNLTFDNAQVDARYTTYNDDKWTSQAIIMNGSAALGIADGVMPAGTTYCTTIDNVHILNSRCNSINGVNLGMFIGWVSAADRTVSITNSSIGHSQIDCTAATTSSYVGLFAGYLNTTTNLENLVAYNSTIAMTNEHSSATASFIVGCHNDKTKTLNYNNVAAVGCTLLASAATTGSSGVLGTFNSSASAVTTMSIDNAFAFGNKYGVGTLATKDSATLTAMPKLFAARTAAAITTSSLTLGTATADTTYFVYHAGAEDPATESSAVTTALSGATLQSVLNLMNKVENPAYADLKLKNGGVVTAAAYNYVKGTMYGYNGGNPLNLPLLQAADGEKLTLEMALDAGNVTVQPGVTLELNGFDLTADYLTSFGQVNDKTNGAASILTAQEGILWMEEGNLQMPLYDSAAGAYKLYNYNVVSAGSQEDAANHRVKFGYRINFTNDDAYALLNANAESDLVTFTVNLTCDTLDAPITYVFPASMVDRYVTYKQGGKNPAFTLLVTGLDSLPENTKVTTVPTLTSVTGVARSGAENYCL